MLLSRGLPHNNPALKARTPGRLRRFQHLLRHCVAAPARAGELEVFHPDITAWLVDAVIQDVAVR
ncbi:hypothetical protein [Sediminicurvatus halobius]|uniref:Uncharacterized protein n=1 Tax=Sediminicurvatus halobius TaxID=2182432 RepID=A0A2U2MWZ5_9GAMM|nr:hypothetical protein [Spiribacter halobius]PWG61383.1 hypothetical protein DEM34_16840 [Spiribacter halobius]UEX76596.1 hypothetical protein LMH63_11575 [Spiribacter halobius]